MRILTLWEMKWCISNFFTHKDFFANVEKIPGSLFTPLSYIVILLVFCTIFPLALKVSKDKVKMREIHRTLWIFFVIWEIVIVSWDAFSGKTNQFDLELQLSLYPCSLYLYTMPFVIWGHGDFKWSAMSYLGTLGMFGAIVNIVYPAGQLTYYSVLSFAGMHTVLYHANLLFTYLCLLFSGEFSYRGISERKYLILPAVPSLLLSIPANIVNYSRINSDYMYFTGQLPLIAALLPGLTRFQVTMLMYFLYILCPAIAFLPSYMKNRRKENAYGHSFLLRRSK